MATTPTTPSKLAIIFAGEDFTDIELLDGSKVAVRVRSMPARHLPQIVQFSDEEVLLIEFVCLIPVTDQDEQIVPGWQRVPHGWADNLTDESHIKIYEAAKRLNFSRAAAWAQRQIAAKKFGAELSTAAAKALRPMLENIMGLPEFSPKSSGSPAAPTEKS